MRAGLVAFCYALLALVPLTSSLNAQSSLGTILGNVRDPSGSAIPGATVTVTNIGTNTKSTYQTDATGDYYVPSLALGRYRVEAEKAGFKKFMSTI
jgi:hypothetical protein